MKLALKYGLMITAGWIVWTMLEFLLGFHNERIAVGMVTGWFSVAVPAIVLYYGIKEKRDKHLNGNLTLTDGILTGLSISLVMAISFTTFFLIYNNFINPAWIEMAIIEMTNKLLATNLSDQQIELRMEMFRMMLTNTGVLFMGTCGSIALGFAISWPVSLYLKRESTISSNGTG